LVGTGRRSTINIIDDIVENGEEYDYFQAVRLLSRLNEKQDKKIDLCINPELNLEFSSSNISSINKFGDSAYNIVTTFFGLYGVSSPLPGFYTEELLDAEWNEQESSKGFLDVIHHHLYPMLYQAWLKYKFSYNAIESKNSEYWEIIYSLMGLSKEFRKQSSLQSHLLKYAGILSQQPKTLMGLKTILLDYFIDIPVNIIPCVRRYVGIEKRQRNILGIANTSLTEDMYIGQRIDDRGGLFEVHIGPLNHKQFKRISSQPDDLNFVRELVRMFLIQPLECRIKLVIEKGMVQPLALGEKGNALLGLNAWMVEFNNQRELDVFIHQV